jgi:aryl-alcohol dehydrogenase-like predicted oxidoreductase
MERRRLGRIGHDSSVAILGTAAFGRVEQRDVDAAMTKALDAGVNHIDVAPSYGEAELRLTPWAGELRARGVFVACKTQDRTGAGARAELERSLDRLGLDRFPLYQLHAIVSVEELDRAMPALEALVAAADEGLIDHIGITGHGWEAPFALAEALRRYAFASLMFPINPQMWGRASYRVAAEALLAEAKARNVAVMAIKAAAKQAWSADDLAREGRYATWYEPYDDEASVAGGVRFALTRPITGFCTPGDVRLLDVALAAAAAFRPLGDDEGERLIDERRRLAPVFG